MIKVLTRLAQYSDNPDPVLAQGFDNHHAQYADNHPVQRSDNLDFGLVLVGIVVPSQLQSLTTQITIKSKSI